MENFTLLKRGLVFKTYLKTLIFATVFASVATSIQAQCPLACNNLVNLTLDGACEIEVTPATLLQAAGDQNVCGYTVTILYTNDVPVPGLTSSPDGFPILTGEHIGQTFRVRIGQGSNSCWGNVFVEDKQPPVITCPADYTVECYHEYIDLANQPPLPPVNDNCDDFVTVDVVGDVIVDDGCGAVNAIRTILYRAEDASGNVSEICTLNISFTSVAIDDVIFPPNRDNIEARWFTCDNKQGGVDYPNPFELVNTPWDLNGNGYPEPNEAGVPRIDIDNDGVWELSDYSIFPNNALCKLNVTFNDDVIQSCPQSFKVLRYWTVLDWCNNNGNIETDLQIIKVVDELKPVVSFVGLDTTITADPYFCSSTLTRKYPTVIFDCAPLEDLTWSVGYLYTIGEPGSCVAPPDGTPFNYDDANVTHNGDGTFTLRNLPFGCNWISAIVTDPCGNSQEARYEVTVVDEIDPTPVCDLHTVTTLGDNGWAHIFATTFDDDSHDNCSEVEFWVRRMSNPCNSQVPAGSPSPDQIIISGLGTFFEYERFCCSDIGNTVMVQLLVMDASGNYNTCMVEVEVQDKEPPVIWCPPDLTLDCGIGIDPDNLSGFGTVRNSQGAVQQIVIDSQFFIDAEDGHTGADLGINELFDGYAEDNCNLTVTPLTPIVNLECGKGSITRRWQADDGFNNPVVCSQRITIIDQIPFQESQINWPDDVTVNGCMVDTDPNNPTYGVPTWTGDLSCSQLAYNDPVDQVFNFVDDACFKILRTWTVIDWCNFESYSNGTYDGYWQHVQIIKVNNLNAPTMTCTNVTECTFESDCEGQITLIQDADDDCTPDDQLEWSYTIDLYVGSQGDKYDVGTSGYTTSGNSNDASGTYPVGTHRIFWTVEDMCGNITECNHLFTIQDCKKPTPYCVSDIATVLMPSNGMVEIWAIDYDFGSGAFDNCTSQDDLRFTFSDTPPHLDPRYIPSRRSSAMAFDCDDVMIHTLDVYVWDWADNFEFCTVRIDIQDNSDACPDPSTLMIAGKVSTEDNRVVSDVEVMLENMVSYNQTMNMTDADGSYSFGNGVQGAEYQVSASKNDDPVSGVTAIDLLAIQKHILGISLLDSPYKLIAGDINADAKLSAPDISDLRKLILGIYDEFPANESWRFVDETQVFANPQSPWPFNELIGIDQLTDNQMDNDFLAVKVGDVNGSIDLGLQNDGTTTRSAKTLGLMVEENKYEAEEIVQVAFKTDENVSLAAMQYTLSFDASSLEFMNMESGLLEITSSNINIQKAETGVLTLCWDNVAGTKLNQDDVLFVANFRAKANNNLTNTLYGFSSEITKTVAYNTDLETMNLNLAVRDDSKLGIEGRFDLMQNTPNPFAGKTTISFSLPAEGLATISIYDITGKLVKSIGGTYSEGINSIEIDSEKLGSTGILYYRLQSGDFTATRKMIVLQ